MSALANLYYLFVEDQFKKPLSKLIAANVMLDGPIYIPPHACLNLLQKRNFLVPKLI